MKYDHAYEMFYEMMQFALANGMTSFQSDLMHDAVTLSDIEKVGEPAELMWGVKSNGYGTWLWNFKGGQMPETVANSGVNVLIRYYGCDCRCPWVANFA